MEDARSGKSDSHIYKHWVNHHGGKETVFSFKIVSFFSSALERQVGEAVRIVQTGASQIMNSKSVYNRSSLPRIIAKDTVDEMNLWDMNEEEVARILVERDPEPIMTKKQRRLEAMKDRKTKTCDFTIAKACACAIEFDNQHCGIYAGYQTQ